MTHPGLGLPWQYSAKENELREAYERGLEDAAKECDKVYLDETSGDYWAGQLADRIRQLKHKQGE